MNEENAYNLIDEPWIPVLLQTGENRTVSLGEIFADSEGAIADLALNPYERVAVFRLLLCIAQAALGPERLQDETAWLAAKSAVGPAATEYLKKKNWHDRFFLYGPHAFLQPDCMALAKADSATPRDKLVLRLSSGNKSTLFDHDAASENRHLSDATIALGLIVYQNFSAGGLSGQCVWDGQPTSKSIVGAPCRERSMLFSILEGRSLLETIWKNLVTMSWTETSLRASWGRPFWEFDSLSRSSVAGQEKTLIGHLAPLSRAIKLTPGAADCMLGEALQYPQIPEWREPMASVKLQSGQRRDEFVETYVSSNPARMPWRELASLLAVRETGGRKSALALRHLASLPDEHEFTLWTGGLYSKKAKEVDAVEWRVRLSVEMLEDVGIRRYEDAIAHADRQRGALYSACAEYAHGMLVDEASRFSAPAERIYWDLLAQPENQRIVQDVDSNDYKENWAKATRKAADEAYRRACPSMNARQMEAFAQGFAKLWIRDDTKKNTNGRADSDESEGGSHA